MYIDIAFCPPHPSPPLDGIYCDFLPHCILVFRLHLGTELIGLTFGRFHIPGPTFSLGVDYLKAK